MDFQCYSSGCHNAARANLTSQLVYLTWLLKAVSAMQENIKQNNAKNYIFYHHCRAASLESMKVKLSCMCSKKIILPQEDLHTQNLLFFAYGKIFYLLFSGRTVTGWNCTGANSNINIFHISISYTNNTLLRTSSVFMVKHKMLISNVYCSLILKHQMCLLG